MTNTLYRLGSTYTTPAVPYQPARPAYTSTETVTGIRMTPGSPTKGAWVTTRNPLSGLYETRWDANYPANTLTPVPYSYSALVYHPAVPEVPGSGAQRIDIPPAGWTSFARSQEFVFENGEATFEASEEAAGVIVGLSPNPAPVIGYSHIPHGLFLAGGSITQIPDGTDLGSYATGDTLTMRVNAGTITYKLNGADLGTDASTYDPDASLFLSAALWGAGDLVDAPTLAQIGTPTPAAADITSEAVFASMGGFSSSASGVFSTAVMRTMHAQSYVGGLTGEAGNESAAQFAGLSGASLVQVGGIATSEGVFRPLRALSADRAGIVSSGQLRPLGGFSAQPVTDTLYLLETIVLDVRMDATLHDRIELRPTVRLDIPMTAVLVVPVRLDPRITVDIPLTAGVFDRLEMRERVVIDIDLSIPGAGVEVYAVNLDGYGSTYYSGYAFNSFARIGDRYYGANEKGVFLLEGDDDAGTPIQAAICPGRLDFGTAQQKTIAEAFLGVASPSPMAMKIVDGEVVYLYEALSRSADLAQHRFKFGKGLKANYLLPILYNLDGADFELDELEFAVAVLSRKTRS